MGWVTSDAHTLCETFQGNAVPTPPGKRTSSVLLLSRLKGPVILETSTARPPHPLEIDMLFCPWR